VLRRSVQASRTSDNKGIDHEPGRKESETFQRETVEFVEHLGDDE
jgi:hypothetical protein